MENTALVILVHCQWISTLQVTSLWLLLHGCSCTLSSCTLASSKKINSG